MKTTAASLLLAGLLLPVLGSAAQGTVIYSNNFETGPLGPEWSSNSVLDSAAAFTRFNGRYASGYTQLTLAYPSAPANGLTTPPQGGNQIRVNVTFDFFAIDSWDGNTLYNAELTAVGPDWFDVSGNSTNIFHETFSNVTGRTQSYHTPTVGPALLGYTSSFKDSIYRGISLDFTASEGQDIVIRWNDLGLQASTDESWGIDNVTVSYTNVPAPASLGLLGVGAAFAARRRR